MTKYQIDVICGDELVEFEIMADGFNVRDNHYAFYKETEHSEEHKQKYGFDKYSKIIATFPLDKTIVLVDE